MRDSNGSPTELSSLLRERVKGTQGCFKGPGAFLLWERARRAGTVQPGEEKTQRGPINVCK